ncbi:MAG: M28 family peptidase [Dehalococcoidales bacterium]|nr:MAG: M28 family peptidase [Dehalococcoidales bacterium]
MRYNLILKSSIYFLVCILAFLVGLLSFRMVDPAPTVSPPEKFIAANSARHIKTISSVPHPMGTVENERVRDYIVNELSRLGLTAEVQTTQVQDYYAKFGESRLVDIHNVYVELPGKNSTGTIALAGHYDTAPASPGANDDGSAVGTLLEFARCILSGQPLKNDVLLIFTDAEEPGQFRYGARYFVDNYDNINDVRLVLNFEALGRSGPSIMFETTPGNEELVNAFSKATSNPIAFSFMNDLIRIIAPGSTDMIAFEEKGISGMDFAYALERTVYHTALDNTENLDERSLQHHGNYAVDITRYLGMRDLNELTNHKKGDSVFHSFFGNTLLHYSQWPIIPLSIITGLLLFTMVIIGIRRNKLSLLGIFSSALIFTGELLVIVIFTTLAWWGLDAAHLALGVVVEPTIKAHLLFCAFLVLSLLAMILWRKLLNKRMNRLDITFGPAVFWWIMTILSALYMPGFSFIMTWPLLFSLIPLAFILFSENDSTSWKYLLVISVCSFTIIAIVIAPVYLLFEATGISSPGFSGSPSFPIIGLSILFWVMLVSLLLPQLAIFGELERKRIVFGILSVAMILLVIGIILPGIDTGTLWIYGR